MSIFYCSKSLNQRRDQKKVSYSGVEEKTYRLIMIKIVKIRRKKTEKRKNQKFTRSLVSAYTVQRHCIYHLSTEESKQKNPSQMNGSIHTCEKDNGLSVCVCACVRTCVSTLGHIKTYAYVNAYSDLKKKTEISLGNDASRCKRGAPFCIHIAIAKKRRLIVINAK